MRHYTTHPISTAFARKLYAQRKVAENDIGMKVQNAWKPHSFRLLHPFSGKTQPPLSSCMTIVTTSYWDANRSFKEGRTFQSAIQSPSHPVHRAKWGQFRASWQMEYHLCQLENKKNEVTRWGWLPNGGFQILFVNSTGSIKYAFLLHLRLRSFQKRLGNLRSLFYTKENRAQSTKMSVSLIRRSSFLQVFY